MDCILDQEGNIYLSLCPDLPGVPSGFFETPANFTIPYATLIDPVALKAYLQDKMEAPVGQRIYWWPDLDNFEDQSEEATYQTGVLSERETNPGRYKFKFGITQSLCVHKAMYTHKKRGGGIMLLDMNGKMLLKLNSAGDGAPLQMSMLNPEKLKFSDGSVATESPILVSLKRHTDIDEDGVMVDVSSFIDELVRLADAVITVTSVPDTDNINVTVLQKCDQTPVLGLLQADFIVKTTAGVVQVATGFTDNGDGSYTLIKSTDWADGTVELRAPDLLTVRSYESNVATVNVP